jgi:hypothetical protein
MSRHTIPVAVGLLLAGLLAASYVPVEAQETGCTLTQGFWKTHPEAWPVAGLTLGGAGYTTEQLIQILSTPPRGSAPYILAHQLIAAKLNVLNGADSSGIATTIANADAWLANVGGLNAWPTGAERQTGIAYASQLDAYNNGLSGVPHCEGVPTPTPTPTPTPPPPES